MFGWSKQYAMLTPVGLNFYKDEKGTLLSSINLEEGLQFAKERVRGRKIPM